MQSLHIQTEKQPICV